MCIQLHSFNTFGVNFCPIPETNGDPALLRQVWINLIGNAIKFSSKKPNRIIEAGIIAEGSENIYFVKDNGAGFNMDFSNKLFAVFQRLHSPKEFEGIGIGLSIVQRINSAPWRAGVGRRERGRRGNVLLYFVITSKQTK